MQVVVVVVGFELLAPFPDSPPTAYPRRMGAVGALFEGLKSFLDAASVGIVEVITESESGEANRIIKAVDKMIRFEKIVSDDG